MHIKFLKHGSGSCKKAADYLTQEKDHAGEIRPHIEVLRGDPQDVAAVADSLDFTRKYSSAVVAYAPEDKPTPEQVDAVLNDFAAVAFAGMQDRVSWSAVRHDEQNGGCHVHIICARCDLETGKSFNPAPPGWQKIYDSVRDYHNAENDWARPDDPARARQTEQGRYDLPQDKGRIKTALDTIIENGINEGLIHNRQDVIAELENWGEITRQGKQYISIKPEGFDKAIRLKGVMYGEQFSVGPGEKITIESSRADGNSPEDRQRRATESKRQIEAAISRRTEYNHRRYATPDRIDQTIHEIRLAKNVPGDVGRPAGDRGRELRPHGVHDTPHPEPTGRVGRDQGTTPEIKPSTGDSDKKSDTVRERTASVAGQGRNLGNRSEIGYYMKNSNTEIERFKTEIDLARYLESQGWQKDKYASCRSSAVLMNGQDKIVVGRQRGNFVYKNTKVEGDQGSIIDYIQRRQGLNMGQVRKFLRPALKGDFKPLHDWKAPAYAVDQAQACWVRGQEVFDFDYLKGRGIDPATVQAYNSAIRQDPATKDLYFLHHGQQGFSGYEIKKPDNTGRFSAGGEKTFFPLQRAGAGTVSRVVVTETALDALSYAQVEGMRKDTAYVSMAGNPSEDQLSQLRALCGQHRVQSVVLAHDKDKGGDQQAERCQDVLRGAQAKVTRDTPAAGKDWNELLQFKIKQDLELKESLKRQLAAEKAAEKTQERQRNRSHGIRM